MALVVIGGVAAGLSAAARARRLDANLPILVLEKGDVISYGACGLPFFIEGRVRSPEELVVYTPEYFRQKRNITVRTNARVTAINHARRQLLLEGGERVPYGRLVIATGARPWTALPGSDLPHVFTLHTLGDATRLKRFLDEQRPKTAAVIGAGYIGLEAADALRRLGLAVTVLEAAPTVLRRQDPELSSALCRYMAGFGVELRCGERVESLEQVKADLVLLAVGLRPNSELAADAGIELGRSGAIRTDERTETSVRGVFAAGDCAEITHLVTGRPAYIPLGTTANKMGRAAGANAAGARERFAGAVGTSILRVFDLGIGMTGFSLEQARREGFDPVAARVEAKERPRYFGGKPVTVELVADRASGRLVGGLVMGEGDAALRVNVIAAALHARMRFDEFEDLDLAYAPPFATVWDPLLVAAQQLRKQM
ncbi:MAG: FAD-dependent oxidoreductase [Bryobacteraceae bacterium]